MTPAEHDEVCAVVSHLPHLLANVYLEAIFPHRRGYALFGGPSFRDWSRIAGSCPEVWMDIFLANRGRIVTCVQQFQKKLQEVVCALEKEDEEKLSTFLWEVFRLKEDLRK